VGSSYDRFKAKTSKLLSVALRSAARNFKEKEQRLVVAESG
jgi:hypothetical protein